MIRFAMLSAGIQELQDVSGFVEVISVVQHCAGDKMENNEMGWACGTYG